MLKRLRIGFIAALRARVGRLFERARTERSKKRAEFKRVDLSRLTEKVLLPFEPLFFERSLEFERVIEPGLTVGGSAQQLSELLSILLDNALRYALPVGEVRLRLRAEPSRRCCLVVSNAAKEMSIGQLKRILKSSGRADSAPPRALRPGLSIAADIVEAHHGKIWAEWDYGRICFFVELPTRK